MKKNERGASRPGREHYNRRLKASPIGERARRALDALRRKLSGRDGAPPKNEGQ